MHTRRAVKSGRHFDETKLRTTSSDAYLLLTYFYIYPITAVYLLFAACKEHLNAEISRANCPLALTPLYFVIIQQS